MKIPNKLFAFVTQNIKIGGGYFILLILMSSREKILLFIVVFTQVSLRTPFSKHFPDPSVKSH